jgi:hypothetical protein
MKIYQFIFQCVWDICIFIGQMVLCLAALFWIAGWVSMGPLMLIAAYLDGDMSFPALMLFESFFLVPALLLSRAGIEKYYQEFSNKYDKNHP